MITQGIWSRQMLMICTHWVFAQSETSSGNILCSPFLILGCLMNCICWSWVRLGNYCSGCSNTWKLEMWMINLAIDTLVPQYAGLQGFSKSFDSLKSDTWQGKEILGMIRTLAPNCAPLHVCSVDDKKGTAHTGSDEIVIGAVRAVCDFPELVRKHHHSDLSIQAWDDVLMHS